MNNTDLREANTAAGMTSSTSDRSFLGDGVAGGMGGVASIYAGLPFDTIKVRLQSKAHVKGYYFVSKVVSFPSLD
jgi:hypothetical protein